MKTLSCLSLAALITLPLAAAGADAKSEVKDAIKKLAAQPNYSWTLTPKTEGTESGARSGPVEGKSEKDGFTYLKGTVGENSFEAAAKGDKFVVNYAHEWVVVSEDEEATARIAKRLKAVKGPVEMAADLAGKTKELKKEAGGLYSSDLTGEAALEIFKTLGRRAAEASEAKGSVKFWLKDGSMAKYEFVVKGTITLRGDNREVEITRTMTVEFKDVGTTKVTLPEEARKKLS